MRNRDFEMAASWQAYDGRNLAVGDFAHTLLAVARYRPPASGSLDAQLVDALIEQEGRILAACRSPDDLMLLCSGERAEVQYV